MADPFKIISKEKPEIASVPASQVPRNDVSKSVVIARKPEADAWISLISESKSSAVLARLLDTSEGKYEAISHSSHRSRNKMLAEKYEPIVFSELFGNSNPVEMEIGCGKGKFLVARAINNPRINFFGIDRVSKFMNIGKTRAQKRAISNIRFLRAEARAFLTGAIAPGSVSIFHIYFPDPWPKRRHQVRRVFTPELLTLLHARLMSGGLVEIATDDKDYFDAMKKTIAATEELWENVREAVNERILDGMNKTHYELKWAAEGRPLYYAELKKR